MQTSRPRFVALYADGTIARFDTDTPPATPVRIGVAGEYSVPSEAAHPLATDPTRGDVFFLLTKNRAGAIGVSPGDGRPAYDIPLGEPRMAYTAIALDPGRSRLYVAGGDRGHVDVAVIDVATRSVAAEWRFDRPKHYWLVYEAQLDSEQQRLYLSFHSASATGIEWIDVRSGTLHSCASGQPRYCPSGAHGGFALYRDGIVAATGTARVAIIDATGKTRGSVDTGLGEVHLMEFAGPVAGNRFVAVGPCGYLSGMGIVTFEPSGRAEIDHPSDARRECADRVAVDPSFRFFATAQKAADDRTSFGTGAGTSFKVFGLPGGKRIATFSVQRTVVDLGLAGSPH